MSKIFKIKYIHIIIVFFLFLCAVFALWINSVIFGFKDGMLYTTFDRINAIKGFGWEVDPFFEQAADVIIPFAEDNVFAEYNDLQKLCGFDLTSFCGKTARRYTYRIVNFPLNTSDAQTEVYINLLIFKNRLIGGDCMSPALSGFMLPLDRRFLP